MKNVICALFLVMITVSASAMAETPNEPTSIELSPEVAACMNKCLAGTCSCSGNGTATATAPSPPVVDGRITDLQRQIGELQEKLKPKPVKPGPDRVALLKKEHDALVARVEALEGKPDGASKADIDALKASLNVMRTDLDALVRRVGKIEGRLGAVDDTLANDDKRLANHDDRITRLELTNPQVVSFGLRLGFVGLYSFGTGSNYTGAPVIGDLSFRLTPKWSIVTEAGVSLSTDASGVGTMLRTAVWYQLTPNWSLDTGVSSIWAGYDSQLRAGYAAFLGDIGPTFKSGIFIAHMSVLAGPSFEPRGSSFALGGTALFGVQFP